MVESEARFRKDPNARLDYFFDWRARTNNTGRSDWLGVGETVTAFTLAVDPVSVTDPLVVDAFSEANGQVTVWLTGGELREVYRVTCHIETSQGREDERSFTVVMVDR